MPGARLGRSSRSGAAGHTALRCAPQHTFTTRACSNTTYNQSLRVVHLAGPAEERQQEVGEEGGREEVHPQLVVPALLCHSYSSWPPHLNSVG